MSAGSASTAALRTPNRKWKVFWKDLKRDRQLLLIGLPAFLIILIFCYGPMFGLIYAFQKVGLRTTVFQNKWVGLQYFTQFFGSVYCGRVIKNTLILNFWSIVAGSSVEIFLAILFNEVKNGPFKRFTQSCTYFPHFISTAVVIGMMVNMLNPRTGVLSLLFQNVFGMEAINMFEQPNLFRPMYIISGMWQGAGWGSIIYLGGISGINPELYEAASLDGCGRLQRIWHITLPGIRPVIVTLLVLHIGGMMSIGADKILLMYSPAIYETSDVISTFVYRFGLGSAEYGYGTAVGLFNSVVNLILVVTANWAAKKLTDSSLF